MIIEKSQKRYIDINVEKEVENIKQELMEQDDYTICDLEIKEGQKYKERRLTEWDENYANYRNKPFMNRLTQRQTISFPLTKTTVKTILSRIDDFPQIKFRNKDNDHVKTIYKNSIWDWTMTESKMTIKDLTDKKQVALYGRSFYEVNVENGYPLIDVCDPYDILVDPLTDPNDLQSASYMSKVNIFRPLKSLKKDPRFNKQAVDKIVEYLTKTSEGAIAMKTFNEEFSKKQERLKELGYDNTLSYLTGETIVQLKEHYRKEYLDNGFFEIKYYVLCENQILYEAPLRNILYKKLPIFMNDFYPFTSWGDDIEMTDFWSDGASDVVRPIHKALSIKISQDLEMSIIRGFGMNFYDSTASDTFDPQSFTPQPFGFYPLPGKPNDILKRVDVADVPFDTDLMNYLNTLADGATATSSQIKGQAEKGIATLGEVEVIQSNLEERLSTISIYYRDNMKQLGNLWSMIVDYNPDLNDIPVSKTVKDRVYTENVNPGELSSEKGYSVEVVSAFEQEKDAITSIQRLTVAKKLFAGNSTFDKIIKNKMLDILNLTQDEMSQVMDEDQNIKDNPASAMPETGAMESVQGLAKQMPELQTQKTVA